MSGALGGGTRWLDDVVLGGLVLILAFAPLALGAVHLLSYALLETVQYALLIVWMARIRLEGATPARTAIARSDLVDLALPAALFASLLILQVMPLPPGLIRIISPATYRLYSASFPGWPKTAPFEAWRPAWSANPRTSSPEVEITLPPVGGQKKTRAQAAAPRTSSKAAVTARPEAPATLGRFGDLRWRSLAIAPSVTWAGLIEVLACGAMFFLVLAYPFGFVGAEREADARFIRWLVITLIVVGGGVALIGLAEKAMWNGRILWFFVPRDWSGPSAENLRASGPFVNPDHFANFLAMILPSAVVGAIFPIALNHREQRVDLRLPCAIAAFLMAAGILLSLSRGAWIASVTGVCAGLAMSFKHARERAPAALRKLSGRALPFALAGFVIVLVVLLYLIGPAGRGAAGTRIGATIAQGDGFGLKPAAWRDSLRMIAEFPIFGVGLGGWPELFPHYQRAPWMPFYFRQPENDYIQLLAETGLAGVALALWFGAIVWRKCRAAAARISVRRWPLFAGLGAGVLGALIHEFFDFSLHTPANAALFTILLAALLRLGLTHRQDRPSSRLRAVSAPSRNTYLFAGLLAASAALLIVAAATQPEAAYPYAIGTPKTFAQAEVAAVNHPADAGVHLALAALMPPGAPAALRHQQLRSAVWLNPNDPLARDLYARSLFLEGNKREALAQITLSVFRAPDVESHFYLQPRAIPWLLPDEQHAIYEGFGQAIAAGYESSASGLAQFYRQLGRYTEAAEVSAKAAAAENDDSARLEHLLAAGQDYAQAQEPKAAEKMLRAAIEIDPTDARPYCALMVGVMGPAHNLAGARAIMQEALANGAESVPIEQALADAARTAGDFETAEKALHRVIGVSPSFEAMKKLGDFYFETGKFDRAAIAYQNAIEIDPNSAQAYFSLAQAEEAAFDFAAANRDYARALKLAPDNNSIRLASQNLQWRIVQSRKQAPPAK
ncbi:MAG TPA: O-antigen ligase family protein [Candidatus Binataceae bacterium]|nr:O-antigen ligase family protein [Candidatus Binataceae bacterium]